MNFIQFKVTIMNELLIASLNLDPAILASSLMKT